MKYRIREQNELKPSGVEWLGDIPNSWHLSKLKYLAKIKTGGKDTENKEDEGKYPFFVRSDNIERINSYSFDGEAILTAGDGVGVGRVFHYINGKFDYHQRVYKISNFVNTNGKFFYYYFKENFYKEILKLSAKSTVDSIRLPMLENFLITVPKIEIQQKIANFLDEKSKIFDEAISKKEQLISKLEFAKQSLISEVVTGKLKVVEQNSKLQTIKREKNELKPSGVEWLGDIPKDWQVKKSKYLFEIRKRISGTLGFDVLSITQKGIKIKDITTGGGQLSMDYSKYQIVNIGDFAMNHMDLLTGFVDIAKSQGVTSPDYRVFSLVDKNSDSIYYLYLFQMGYKNQIFFAFGQGSSQLGRWRFPTEEFNKFYFPYPSLEEQQKISKYLDEKLIHFDNTIEKTKQSIKKLKLAKEALISQAVTGKIEVL